MTTRGVNGCGFHICLGVCQTLVRIYPRLIAAYVQILTCVQPSVNPPSVFSLVRPLPIQPWLVEDWVLDYPVNSRG